MLNTGTRTQNNTAARSTARGLQPAVLWELRDLLRSQHQQYSGSLGTFQSLSPVVQRAQRALGEGLLLPMSRSNWLILHGEICSFYINFWGEKGGFSIVLLCVFGVNKILAAVSIYFSINGKECTLAHHRESQVVLCMGMCCFDYWRKTPFERRQDCIMAWSALLEFV